MKLPTMPISYIINFLSLTRGVSHCGLAIYIQKVSEGKKEELWKFKYFTMQKSERNQNPSRYYYNSITNLKFQHKPKYHLSKILILKKIKLDLLLLPRGQNPLSYYTL